MSYSTSQNFGANIVTISAKRAKEVIALNKKGTKPESLDDHSKDEAKPVVVDYENGVGQDSLTRFDTGKKRPNNKHKRPNNNRPQQAAKPETTTENKKSGPRFQKPIKKNNNGSENNEK